MMTRAPATQDGTPPLQGAWLAGALVLFALVILAVVDVAGWRKAALGGVGWLMGMALYHAAFGFTGAYRRAFVEKDTTGITAQSILVAAAMVIYAPFLAEGQAFGQGVSGAVAPIGYALLFGAFIFGVGMQLGGGCGSGTLFTAGGGNVQTIVTLVFFCIGGFWASLDLQWWVKLPRMSGVSLGETWGYALAVPFQLAVLFAIWWGLRQLGASDKRPLWPQGGMTAATLIRGPWPLVFSALLLAVLSWLVLVLAGHTWSITWAFTLWAAKAATVVGWDPSGSWFWTGGFTERSLKGPLLRDTTSVVNIAIALGALSAAALAGKVSPNPRLPWRNLAACIIGGLLLGYGARLAYGCNIGAFFSGVASTSLHGWVWIAAAIAGNWIGIKLRPHFHLSN